MLTRRFCLPKALLDESALQGIEDKFLEQWHQKLHTNTTPEDITICEAYLHFLHCGDPGEMYRVLWENGRITRDMLASMDKPITRAA